MDQQTQWPDIILVNGPSSAGKSTLSKALQDELLHPYLHFGFDDLVFMSPRRYWGGAETREQKQEKELMKQGVEMVETQAPGEPKSVVAVFGPVLRHVIDAMAPVVGAMVKAGNSVIFDHVFHDKKMYDDCVEVLAPYNVFTVGVYCDLEVLEKREYERGDRVVGRARGLYDVVHSFCSYDVSVDTSKMSIQEAANIIKKGILEVT